ncbi:Lrp/AsnC family transcriptional regulator [Pseudoclavibacter sp. CFCC 11306]|uniref:Lrp/AsnC family transcriptional regulator n=1 Tax=Pseudoclavibacter sp. CFCC 11306 TaxID=1564493 RepID=UPI0013014ED3|nr:Lrp/AsnC family transcriptional regulator [Pseudoclavibacter sp. CFCC 11306]KAB1659214.1 Lrp/AsnC family transcriptional regulator [Pseudoclavibacter sp. CFCC 11306]
MTERVDEIDRIIIDLLMRDGRARLAALAEATGLSTSAVQLRLRRLESTGLITGYQARVDYDRLGRSLTALIEITPVDPGQPDDAPERLHHVEGIVSCYSVAGAASYVLFVRVAGPDALEQLIGSIRLHARVTTRTTIILSTPFEHRHEQLACTPTGAQTMTDTATTDTAMTDKEPQ